VKECHPVFDEHCSTQYSKAGHRLLRKEDRESTDCRGNVAISSINGMVWHLYCSTQYSKAGHRLLRKEDRESTDRKGNVAISSINVMEGNISHQKQWFFS
jgi:hypothetical protein